MMHRITILTPSDETDQKPGLRTVALEKLCDALKAMLAARFGYDADAIFHPYAGGTTTQYLVDVVFYDGHRQRAYEMQALMKQMIEDGTYHETASEFLVDRTAKVSIRDVASSDWPLVDTFTFGRKPKRTSS